MLADGIIGHAWEKLVVPEDVPQTERKVARKDDKVLFGDKNVAPMPVFGKGLFAHVTGSTHREDGMRDVNSKKVHEDLIKGYYEKIESHKDHIVDIDEYHVNDAEILVISYGISARPSLKAVRKAREEGIKAGLVKLNTLWPFPKKEIRKLVGSTRETLVVEMNLGQVHKEVERVTSHVDSLNKIGGGIAFTSKEIYSKIKEMKESD